MGSTRVAAFFAMLMLVGCGGSVNPTFEQSDPTPEQVDALLTSMTTWDAGSVGDLDPSGVTEVFSPPDSVIIGTTASDVRVFRQKDPNNGCRLQVEGDELYDPCHGHSYDLDGAHTDPACERSLYEFAVEIVDQRIIVTLSDDAQAPTSPICTASAGVEH